MNTENRIKVSVLRILAFTLVLCVVAVAAFAFSEMLVERLLRGIDASKDANKNAIWVLGHMENLLFFPIVAFFGALLYRNVEDNETRAIFHKEKKIGFILLFIFVYFAFLPYYVTQNMAGDMSVFDAIGDKVLWFSTQVIPLLALIMYHSDREKKYLCDLERGEVK